MKRLSDLEMMDYLDGTLSPEGRASVEAHLAQNAEDAELLADLRMAQSVLHEMEAADPVQASDDFWQKVRAQLPAERKPAKSLLAQIGSWIWPANSPVGMSLRVAVVAAFLAMMATWFGPGQVQNPTIAGQNGKPTLTDQQKENPAKRDTKPVPGAVNSDESADTDN